jgi:hypothetical protein
MYADFLVASGLGVSPRRPSTLPPCSGVEYRSSCPYCAPRWCAQRVTARLCMLASLYLRCSESAHVRDRPSLLCPTTACTPGQSPARPHTHVPAARARVWRPLLAPTEDSHTTHARCGYLTWPTSCAVIYPMPCAVMLVFVQCSLPVQSVLPPPRHAHRGEGGPPLPEGSSAV